MGIVICVVLGLGSISLLWPKVGSGKLSQAKLRLLALDRWVPAVLMSAGLWNIFWYGARHLTSFWGNAAVVSGAIMLLAALLILGEKKPVASKWLLAFSNWIKPFRSLIVMGLVLSFLLYAVTLIQLNLGSPIIR